MSELRRASGTDVTAVSTIVDRQREPRCRRRRSTTTASSGRSIVRRPIPSAPGSSTSRSADSPTGRTSCSARTHLSTNCSGSYDRSGQDLDIFVPKNVPWMERDYFNAAFYRVLPSNRVRTVSRGRCAVEHALLRGDHVPFDPDRVEPAAHRKEQGRAVDRLQGVLPGRRARLGRRARREQLSTVHRAPDADRSRTRSRDRTICHRGQRCAGRCSRCCRRTRSAQRSACTRATSRP